MKTKVKVQFFKESGKLNISEEFETELMPFDVPELIFEIRKMFRVSATNNDFVFEATAEHFSNIRLVRN